MEVAEAPKQMAVTSPFVLRQLSLSTGTTELGEGGVLLCCEELQMFFRGTW